MMQLTLCSTHRAGITQRAAELEKRGATHDLAVAQACAEHKAAIRSCTRCLYEIVPEGEA